MFILEKSWHNQLEEELSKPYIAELNHFLVLEKKRGAIIYPPEPLIFAAFDHTPFDQVQVVIVGQDPYHGEGQAEGLCFSVPKAVLKPPSLCNIDKELADDLGIPLASHGSLTSWAHQGVLLLNTLLTVRREEPGSHKNRGWELLTDAVLKRLFLRKDPLVFMLWGNYAKTKCKKIFSQESHPHLILEAAHPSPLSVRGFKGCAHFSKANTFLLKNGKKEINWQRDV